MEICSVFAQYHGFSWRHQADHAAGLHVAGLPQAVPVDAFRVRKIPGKTPFPRNPVRIGHLGIAFASNPHTMPVTQAVRIDKGQRTGSPIMQIP